MVLYGLAYVTVFTPFNYDARSSLCKGENPATPRAQLLAEAAGAASGWQEGL